MRSLEYCPATLSRRRVWLTTCKQRCHVLPELTPHICCTDSHYLKPKSCNTANKRKKGPFFSLSRRHCSSCILNLLAGVGLLIHLCSPGAERWCKFLIISQVFVCSRALPRLFYHHFFFLFFSTALHKRRRGTNPWPTVLVFLLSQGLEVNSF